MATKHLTHGNSAKTFGEGAMVDAPSVAHLPLTLFTRSRQKRT